MDRVRGRRWTDLLLRHVRHKRPNTHTYVPPHHLESRRALADSITGISQWADPSEAAEAFPTLEDEAVSPRSADDEAAPADPAPARKAPVKHGSVLLVSSKKWSPPDPATAREAARKHSVPGDDSDRRCGWLRHNDTSFSVTSYGR